jgi:hypothetical protein
MSEEKRPRMLRDHYVSRVHLRNFYAPTLHGEKLFATRKPDLLKFKCSSKDVCFSRGGSNNEFIVEGRAIEEFLKYIEPAYNASVRKLSEGHVDHDATFTISGFVAYVLTCSPAGLRINCGPIKASLEVSHQIMEAEGRIPPPPPILGFESIGDLIDSGRIALKIDPKFPQALGITNILNNASALANGYWELLVNSYQESPYFTSDYPIALEIPRDARVLQRIVPLSPNLALRIRPVPREEGVDISRSPDFRFQIRNATFKEVTEVNKLIVRSAETLVFSSVDFEWVDKFISKNSKYRVESITTKIPIEKGYMNHSTLRIMPTSEAP